MTEQEEPFEVLKPQPTNEQTAVVVENYPYGWTRRTQARYWVETTKNGQREVFQTKNSNSGKWNNPKKSTYSDIIMMVKVTSNGHIEGKHFSTAYTNREELDAFLSKFPYDSLDDYQKKRVIEARAVYDVRAHLTFKIHTNPTAEEQAEIKKNEEETRKLIPRMMSHYVKTETEAQAEKDTKTN